VRLPLVAAEPECASPDGNVGCFLIVYSAVIGRLHIMQRGGASAFVPSSSDKPLERSRDVSAGIGPPTNGQLPLPPPTNLRASSHAVGEMANRHGVGRGHCFRAKLRSIKRRTATAKFGWSVCFCAQTLMACCSSFRIRTPTKGVVPVAGRPRRLRCTDCDMNIRLS
jgi:hypothetical protein